VILACTVLIGLQSVTDRRTYRQTPRPYLKRAKHSAVARNKKLFTCEPAKNVLHNPGKQLTRFVFKFNSFFPYLHVI